MLYNLGIKTEAFFILMTPDQNDNFFTLLPLSDAATYAGTKPDYLRYLIFKGKLKGYKTGKIWFTKKEWIDEYKNTLKKLDGLSNNAIVVSEPKEIGGIDLVPEESNKPEVKAAGPLAWEAVGAIFIFISLFAFAVAVRGGALEDMPLSIKKPIFFAKDSMASAYYAVSVLGEELSRFLPQGDKAGAEDFSIQRIASAGPEEILDYAVDSADNFIFESERATEFLFVSNPKNLFATNLSPHPPHLTQYLLNKILSLENIDPQKYTSALSLSLSRTLI